MSESGLLDPPARAHAGGRDRGGRGRGSGGGGGRGRGDEGSDGDSLPVSNPRFLMILALVASTMLFSGLIGVFVVLRDSVEVWPPAGTPPIPRWLWANLPLALAGSGAVALAQRAARRGEVATLRRTLLLATFCASAFLAVQGLGWRELLARGFLPRSNNYAGKFWMLTLAHFLHAAVGWLMLLLPTLRALRGAAPARVATQVGLAGLLWHFVDAAWIVIWGLLVV
jgi:cytochrome c oxidase subunit 3